MLASIIHEEVASIQTKLPFPWAKISSEFPLICEFFQLAAVKDKTTPESLFFNLSCAIVSIASETVTINCGRHITPSLWIIGYNQSGTGKSSAIKVILDAFSDPSLQLTNRVITEGTAEGILKSLSDTESRFLIIDELHQFFNQCGCGSKTVKGYASQLLSLFSSNPVVKKTATSNAQVTLRSPKLVLLGNIQSPLLVSAIANSKEHRESGFFTRFNYFTSSYRRPSNSEAALAEIQFLNNRFPKFSEMLASVRSIARADGASILNLDTSASLQYNSWEQDLTNAINVIPKTEEEYEKRNILQKSEGNTLVFALIFWFLDMVICPQTPTIPFLRDRHVRAGICVWDYLVKQHEALIKISLSHPTSDNSIDNATFDYIINNSIGSSRLTFRQMYRSPGMNEKKLRLAVGILVSNEVGALRNDGRHGKYFFLHEPFTPKAIRFLNSIGHEVGAPSVSPIVPIPNELPEANGIYSVSNTNDLFPDDQSLNEIIDSLFPATQ